MSALELIERLKALPAHQQADFAQLFRQMQDQGAGAPRGSEQNATAGQWPDFTSRLRRKARIQ
jgi:hypothetical protein